MPIITHIPLESDVPEGQVHLSFSIIIPFMQYLHIFPPSLRVVKIAFAGQ